MLIPGASNGPASSDTESHKSKPYVIVTSTPPVANQRLAEQLAQAADTEAGQAGHAGSIPVTRSPPQAQGG